MTTQKFRFDLLDAYGRPFRRVRRRCHPAFAPGMAKDLLKKTPEAGGVIGETENGAFACAAYH